MLQVYAYVRSSKAKSIEKKHERNVGRDGLILLQKRFKTIDHTNKSGCITDKAIRNKIVTYNINKEVNT